MAIHFVRIVPFYNHGPFTLTHDRPLLTVHPYFNETLRPYSIHLVFKYGEKDIHKLQIHCDVTDKIGDVITKFHEKHGKKYSKVIFDGDVIPAAAYKKTLSELDIDDEDCLEVRE